MEEPEFKSHLQINAAERDRLLSRLDASARSTSGGREARTERRWPYRTSDIAVIVQHPGGGTGRFLVCSRNLSAGGIGFIHGGYLHPGSECSILLRDQDGSPMALAGKVAHCRHLSGRYHEIGIKFSEKIDPVGVLGSTITATEEGDGETIELPWLNGNVLLVDHSETDRRLLTHQLQATGLAVEAVDSSGAALDALHRHKFDLVICDPTCEEQGAKPLIVRIRGMGYSDPIVVLTAETDRRRLEKAGTNQASDMIGKPYALETLLSVLGTWLGQRVCTMPVYSSLADHPEIAALIPGFIKEVDRISQKLEKAVASADLEAVRAMCQSLCGSGSNYGFDAISAAAREALKKLDSTNSVARTKDRLQHVMESCRCLRFDGPSSSSDSGSSSESAA